MKIFDLIKENKKKRVLSVYPQCLKHNFYGQGFTLVETLVAVSIFSMSIVVLMSVLGGGISDTQYAKEKMMAGYLAQEGIEYARNVRDTNVLYDVSPQDGWNAFKLLSNSDITPSNNVSGFTRTVTKTAVNTNEVKVTSEVEWTQKSGTFNITLTENLFNWVE